MEIKATLKPGQNGTKRFVQKYGEGLVCVRYRYDKASKRRYTTVELIVDEIDWTPSDTSILPAQPEFSGNLPVRIHFHETELREKAKALGAIWRPRQRLWEMSHDAIMALGIEDRIVMETGN